MSVSSNEADESSPAHRAVLVSPEDFNQPLLADQPQRGTTFWTKTQGLLRRLTFEFRFEIFGFCKFC